MSGDADLNIIMQSRPVIRDGVRSVSASPGTLSLKSRDPGCAACQCCDTLLILNCIKNLRLQVKCWCAEIVGRVCVGVMGISVSLIKECKFSAASPNIWMRKEESRKMIITKSFALGCCSCEWCMGVWVLLVITRRRQDQITEQE